MSDLSPRRLALGVAAIWALAAAILLAVARHRIAQLGMWDPDDFLRLQQVRDWLGGQSFFDVTQYRIDPPHGVPMHWSRIVDLPIAGLILLLQPLLGAAAAERVAACAVPLITLAGSLAAVALVTARLADRRAALLAAALAATAPMILFHDLPLRIDHHGWQTMLGLFTVAACFDRDPRRGGIAGGIAAALWLAISLEALPMVIAIALLLGLRGLWRGGEPRLRAFAGTLGIASLALFAVFHGRAAWSQYWCDAVSPAWFGPLIVTPLVAAIGLRIAAQRGPAARVAALGIAAALGVALLAATAPACLAGPFGTLDPVSRRFWYDNVLEGLPVWRQPADNAAMLLGFPLVGLAGTLLAWRGARTAAEARDWLTMLAILGAAFAVSLLVQRASGFAHGCALPGAGWLLARLLGAIGRWRSMPGRVLGSAAALLALSPIGAIAAGGLVVDRAGPEAGKAGAPSHFCLAPCTSLEALAHLPRSTILTGLDLTPRLLVATPHSYAGSGHHRDPQAIRRVILTFTGPPEAARRVMAAHGMAYVLIDPTGTETGIYAGAAPNGLMAALVAGKAPAWLVPVPLAGSTLKLWRRIP
ncbi:MULTISPECIES: hypothetical protein [unclassified Sphingomonas]|uniref:hypothetical protein n=1 Tax=unclassified Sphingomonas TaxID=196159 RepID=UPI00070062BE|nr:MULTISPECIES: hypothetical protein [unclassified Sphingomonas]KQX25312.1 hypothetical protein ASD17_21085 [Sphingomonas sp. Root1294]KQY66304.1 hypothetical protein ASD39_10890 [Sphingomonas sp. Root50]KRB90386.1 hypothetical protein ASE22_16060 [Sphingomonas sp. Root720]